MPSSNVLISVLTSISYIHASFLSRIKRWSKIISTYLILHIMLLEERVWCSDITTKCTINHRKYTLQSLFHLVWNITLIGNNHLLDMYYCLCKTCSSSFSLWHIILPGMAPRVLLKHGYISCYAISVTWLILLGLHSSQPLQEGKKKKKSQYWSKFLFIVGQTSQVCLMAIHPYTKY